MRGSSGDRSRRDHRPTLSQTPSPRYDVIMANPAQRNDVSPKVSKVAPIAPDRAAGKSGLIEKLASAADEAEAALRFDLSGLSRSQRRERLFGK